MPCFLFSVIYDVDRPFYFRPVSKVFITAFSFFNRAFIGRNQKNGGLAEYLDLFVILVNAYYAMAFSGSELNKKLISF